MNGTLVVKFIKTQTRTIIKEEIVSPHCFNNFFRVLLLSFLVVNRPCMILKLILHQFVWKHSSTLGVSIAMRDYKKINMHLAWYAKPSIFYHHHHVFPLLHVLVPDSFHSIIPGTCDECLSTVHLFRSGQYRSSVQSMEYMFFLP